MKQQTNPLFAKQNDPAIKLDAIKADTVHKGRKRSSKIEIRDLRRKQTAAEAIDGFGPESEFYGFTKGQFSLVDVLEAVLDITGPAALTVSTWAAAKTSVNRILDFVKAGRCTESRWLIDLTLQRRLPELTKSIRDTFGKDAIRVGSNHSKFFMLRNAKWDVICITSMNLNHNPRFENFLIRNDESMCHFHSTIFDEIWTNQPKQMAYQNSAVVNRHFANSM